MFTISFWFTKEECTGSLYEYLFSHHNNDDASTTWQNSYVDIFLACEGNGGGYSSAAGSIMRYWLRDQAGHEASMDFPLHSAGGFDAITNVWVHTILTVSPSSLVTFDDGNIVADSAYGYYPNVPGNTASPTPSSLSTAFSGASSESPIFDLQTDLFLGGRVDSHGDRHFHGSIALFRVYSGDVDAAQALSVFEEGDRALMAVPAVSPPPPSRGPPPAPPGPAPCVDDGKHL